MKKRLTCAFLALALCLGLCPAFGAGTEEKFPAVNTYPGYADVKEGDWFYQNAKLCYETGLMNGTGTGFEPNKVLSKAEAVTLAARVGAALRGETIRPAQPGESWWEPYREYRFPNGGGEGGDSPATRWDFLFMLYLYVYEENLLTPINDVKALPDSGDAMVLNYYNAGILTGVDKYGTFAGGKSLTRAEAAAMVSRIIRPGLRLSFTPADYSPFTAAYLTPDTVMFEGGVTAEEYLITVNNAIAAWEAALGEDFNWHYIWTDGKSVLNHVKEDSLSALAVTAKQGTQAYKDFDVQVYYSRLIDLTGKTLAEPSAQPSAQSAEPTAQREYALTEIALPEGWSPTADSNNMAAGWAAIQRVENERVAEEAIYRADGTVLDLGEYFVYGFEHPTSRGNAKRLLAQTYGTEILDYEAARGSLWNIYDVEQERFLLEKGIFDDDPAWKEAQETYLPSALTWPQPRLDKGSGLYGYVDREGNQVIPAQYDLAGPFVDGAAVVYFRDGMGSAAAIDETGREILPRRYSELWYLGDGVFNYWGDLSSWEGDDWRRDCGTVTMEGVETPTATFSGYFNGGLAAHHGLIAMGHEADSNWVMAYYDYAGNQVTEDFDWAGPIGDDGAGFVCRDGKLCRIQF